VQYTIAMLGYGPENETTVLELTYNYGVTEYTKGDAYGQVCIFHSFVLVEVLIMNAVDTIPADS
jgi:lactoylglutathione lyase